MTDIRQLLEEKRHGQQRQPLAEAPAAAKKGENVEQQPLVAAAAAADDPELGPLSLQTCGSDSENGVTLQTGSALPPLPQPERLLQSGSQAEVCTADWAWPVRTAEGFTPARPKTERKVSQFC